MRELLYIKGGRKLEGSVQVSGAKNSALPLLVATLLTSQPCTLSNVPDLDDISVILQLLKSLGAEAKFIQNTVIIQTPEIKDAEAPYRLVKSLRASFLVLGPLLARAGSAHVALPGGDAIGTRPVDIHLKGLTKLGADITMRHGVVHATAPIGLSPAHIVLEYPSVGATHHLLTTAALIPGETVITGAACEPEVVDLASLLIKMGARIEGQGTGNIRIVGCRELQGAEHTILGDRIEAASFLIAGAMTGGQVAVNGAEVDHFQTLLDILELAGCRLDTNQGTVSIQGPERLNAVSFATGPFPTLATDMQPLLMAAMVQARGVSSIEETVFENRFGHVAEFRRFGAEIYVEGQVAHVHGLPMISGAPVDARDIRAAFGLLLLGLAASGETTISEIHHLDRGYEHFIEKLVRLGATVSRVPGYDDSEIVLGC